MKLPKNVLRLLMASSGRLRLLSLLRTLVKLHSQSDNQTLDTAEV